MARFATIFFGTSARVCKIFDTCIKTTLNEDLLKSSGNGVLHRFHGHDTYALDLWSTLLAVRHYNALETHFLGLDDSPLQLTHSSQLAPQADFADEGSPGGDFLIKVRRHDCHQHGQVGRRLPDFKPARYVQKETCPSHEDTCVLAQDSEKHEKPVVVDSVGAPDVLLVLPSLNFAAQGLNFDQKRPRSFHCDGDCRIAQAVCRGLRKEDARVEHGLEAIGGHFEHPNLVCRSVTVFRGPQEPVVLKPLALKVQDNIDQVLQHLRTRKLPAFRHMSYNKRRNAVELGRLQQSRGALAYLAL
mmetsp:Transcript_3246/g.9030  ORF Transcript_3246/g.9030 Transcript_3246/m.9030 type:complete len:301 (-) Transcript_3246:1093-1995(-)